MTVAALPWSILYPRSAGGNLATSLQNLVKKYGWWLGPAGAAVAVLTFVVGAVAGAIGMHQFYAKDVPEIKQGINAIKEELGLSQARQRAELVTHIDQEQIARERTDSSLKVIRSHLLAVIQRVERRQLKPGEFNELLSNVRDVSKSEATQLSGVTTVQGGPLPQPPPAITAMAKAGKLAPDLAEIFNATDWHRASIGTHLARALVAKDGKWEALDKGIKFSYEGGATIFSAKQNVTRDNLAAQAELLNSFSRALESLGGVEIKPWQQPGRGNDGMAPTIPETRAPNLPLESPTPRFVK